MSNEKNSFKDIIDFKYSIEKTFFRKFEEQYNLPSGINATHMHTLIALSFEGSSKMSKISDALFLEKGSFTTISCQLFELGYITKTKNEKDKRICEISITEKGKTLAEEYKSEHLKFVDELFKNIDENEVSLFYNAINTANCIIRKINFNN